MRTNNTPTPVADWNWPALAASLDRDGYAVTPQILSTADCTELITLYDQPGPWRSRIEPDRYRLGPGEYQQFDNPLPETVQTLREECYEHLAPIADAWHDKLGMPTRYPTHLKEFIDTCHIAGQTRPTPLVQRHRTNDFHSLHQESHHQHVPVAVDDHAVQAQQGLQRRPTDARGKPAHEPSRVVMWWR